MAFDPLQRTPGPFVLLLFESVWSMYFYIGVNVEYYTFIFNLLILNLSFPVGSKNMKYEIFLTELDWIYKSKKLDFIIHTHTL